MVAAYIPFTFWEWQEEFEILVFEQFALSKISNTFEKESLTFYFSVYGLGGWLLTVHSAPEPVHHRKNVTKGPSMDSVTNINIK